MTQGFTAKLEAGRPIQGVTLAIIGKGQWRAAQLRVINQADLEQADIVLLLTTEMGQRLLNFSEQRRQLPVSGDHLQQALFTKRLTELVTGLQHTIGEQKNPITQRQRVDLILVVECGRFQHTQRQVPRHQRQTLATNAQQIAIRQASIPYLDHLALEADIQHRRTAKHPDGENAFELGIDLA